MQEYPATVIFFICMLAFASALGVMMPMGEIPRQTEDLPTEKHTYQIYIHSTSEVFHSDTLASHDDYWYIEDSTGRAMLVGKCLSIAREDSTYFVMP